MTRSPDLLVRVLLAIVAGLLLIAAGVALASDGGRAMASLNERYARWQRVPPYRVMAAQLIVNGAIWTVFGISSALG